MEIGLGVERDLLTFAEYREVARAAARGGYGSCWVPAGIGGDAFQICAQWWGASGDVVSPGLTTGISVVPVPIWSPPALATSAGALGDLTGGRFILGIGSGGIHSPAYRRMFNVPEWPPLALMRDFLVTLRGLLDGESVSYAGKAVTLRGVRLPRRTDAPRVPIALGALGPGMVRLAGELSDGAALNWCTPEQITWSRERVAEGAARAGRDPGEVQLIEYIRICVDDDEDAARRALARAVLPYALVQPDSSKEHGYRAHFARMGFDAALSDLEARRDRGTPVDQLADAFPTDLLLKVGYFGRAAGAAAAFARLAQGLDTAIVRVVPVRPALPAVLAVLEACRPELVRGAK